MSPGETTPNRTEQPPHHRTEAASAAEEEKQCYHLPFEIKNHKSINSFCCCFVFTCCLVGILPQVKPVQLYSQNRNLMVEQEKIKYKKVHLKLLTFYSCLLVLKSQSERNDVG